MACAEENPYRLGIIPRFGDEEGVRNLLEVGKRLQLDYSPAYIYSQTRMADDAASYGVEIEVRDYDGETANRIAREWAQLFVEFRNRDNAKQRREDRVEAIRALGCLEEEAARSALLNVLEREATNAGRSDGSERAGEAAAFAAGEAGETRALPALLRMARTPWDGRSFTPQAAADAIVKIAARTGAAPALKTVSNGLRDPVLRDRFLWAEGQLVRVRSGEGLDAVRRLYAADRRSLVAATGRAR